MALLPTRLGLRRQPPWTLADVRQVLSSPTGLSQQQARTAYLQLRSGQRPLTREAAVFRATLLNVLRVYGRGLCYRPVPARPSTALCEQEARRLRLRRRKLQLEACPDCRRVQFLIRHDRRRLCPCGASWWPCRYTHRIFVVMSQRLVRYGHLTRSTSWPRSA